MLATVKSATLIGIDAHPVTIEIDIRDGLQTFTIVGLPDAAVKESRDRVRAAIRNSGFVFPDQIVTVNLAPADLKKEGSHLDLAIALGILRASRQIAEIPPDALYIGELSLSGALRPVPGVISMAIMAENNHLQELYITAVNAREAAVCPGLTVYPVTALQSLTSHLMGMEVIRRQPGDDVRPEEMVPVGVDLADVRGQWQAKRALEIAAAGGHNLLMVGPPGTGKSILAQRLPTLFPLMSIEEALETTRIHSAAGLLPADVSLLWQRPFRSPHHTVSSAGLTGGGNTPRPGEITLAHNGVLFLDELTEFRRDALESMRQPMENRCITITRSNRSLTFPARFMLVAAMNPCPCGNLGHPRVVCRCTPNQVTKYRSKISGPLMDRIDLAVDVPALTYDEFSGEKDSLSSEMVRTRVARAREIQSRRLESGSRTNASMGPTEIEKNCRCGEEGRRLLKSAMDRFGLSGRSIHRAQKVARTIADLAGSESIETAHIAEALTYRFQNSEL